MNTILLYTIIVYKSITLYKKVLAEKLGYKLITFDKELEKKLKDTNMRK